jgi:hypothetical protein
MKHLKSIDQFLRVDEQLFGADVRKFGERLFGKEPSSSSKSNANPVDASPQGDSNKKGSDIKVQKTDKAPDSAKDLGSYGKFTSSSNVNSPLVVVYGGIDVGGRKSGVYMYDYFGGFGDKYNLFVAKDANINGLEAYKAIQNKVGNSPSKKILYLFSGGYRPGKKLLEEYGAKEFDKIYLVDIWMGNESVGSFYNKLAQENPDKVEYYYTSFGANNSSARDKISSSVKVKMQQLSNNHMETNLDAVKSLSNYA